MSLKINDTVLAAVCVAFQLQMFGMSHTLVVNVVIPMIMLWVKIFCSKTHIVMLGVTCLLLSHFKETDKVKTVVPMLLCARFCS